MDQFPQQFLPPYFAIWHLPLVFLAGVIGEGYAVVVGGGGILIQFVLASLGMPLVSVVATDLAGSMGANVGILAALRRTETGNKNLILLIGLPFFVGGVIGTAFLTRIPLNGLRYLLILALFLVLIYMLFGRRRHGMNPSPMGRKQYSLVGAVMFGLGIYNNVSAVGSGTFQKIVYMGLLRGRAADSIAINAITEIPPTLFSFAVTAASGLIAWPYLLTLWAGTFVGANFVARHVRKVPDSYLRVLLMVITAFYLIYLLHAVLVSKQ